MAQTLKGTVKWFNDSKGYGFIFSDDGDDIFVHYQSIKNEPKTLKKGQRVEFEVAQGAKGKEAKEVVIIS